MKPQFTTSLTAILTAIAILFAGCDRERTESDVQFTLQRHQTGPFIAGTMDAVEVVFGNRAISSPSLTWSIALRRSGNTNWVTYNPPVSIMMRTSFSFIVPDSSNDSSQIQIQCTVRGDNQVLTETLEGQIASYQSTTHPSYKGTTATCNQCHSAFVTAWSQTGHATALPLSTTTFLMSCGKCHATGYDTTRANGGADELWTDRLAGVQCEACHGPSEEYGTSGTSHISTNSFTAGLSITSQQCLACHQLTNPPENHHSFRYTASHSYSFSAIRAVMDTSADRDRCAGCHLTSEAIRRLDGDSVSHWAGSGTGENGIGCIVCHGAHPRNSNPYKMLRATPDRLCQACHQPGTDLPPSVNKLPLHPQADMLANNLTVIIPLTNVTLPASGEHGNLQGSCAICHLYATSWQTGTNPVGNHSFQVVPEACTSCHPGVGTSFIGDSQALFRQRLDSLNIRVDMAQARGDTTQDIQEANWIRFS